ncbi:unnamed protein product [Meloidogyne enterolobii]|uniref:Uncharacterized protein n=1 Tax=Meloidogyne enterolobii TaxID=390850 RepID=A0ACB1B290_MELEN
MIHSPSLNIFINSSFFRPRNIIEGITKLQHNFLSAMHQEPPSLKEINILKDSVNPNVFNVQLNRAEKRNTFTDSFWRELKTAFSYLSEEPTCRSIVLSANGPVFCAGIDLKEGIVDTSKIMLNEELDVARKSRLIRELIKRYQESFSSLEECPKPEVDIGIAADVGILQRIHRIVGNDSWSREMAFTGRDASADEAMRMGFISRTFDTKEDCYEAAMSLARQIASKSPVAVQGTKLAMNYARSHGIEDSSEWIRNWNASMLQTMDISENVKAKLSKTSDNPVFKDF